MQHTELELPFDDVSNASADSSKNSSRSKRQMGELSKRWANATIIYTFGDIRPGEKAECKYPSHNVISKVTS